MSKRIFSTIYNTSWGDSLCVRVGDELYPMHWSEGGVWTSDPIQTEEKKYSFCVMRQGLVLREEWLPHNIKKLNIRQFSPWNDCPIEGCRFPRRHTFEEFDDPFFRGAGTVVPVFALRSAKGYGIGDFGDLLKLICWIGKTGQCVLQLLPITDTTVKGDWSESYPYNPVSAFAINPLYLDVYPSYYDLEKRRKKLNALPEIDYPEVFRLKMEAIARWFLREKAGLTWIAPGFVAFVEENAYWLPDYAQFKAKMAGSLGDDTEEEEKARMKVDGFEMNAYKEVKTDPQFYEWVQYELYLQLRRVCDRAKKNGVVLKGDLPIGVGAHSADAWKHPELFNLDSTAGAPPDFFSAEGQNWGFPTYNWDAMERDGYKWWRERMREMAKYFEAFRIDHILGFFRIWEIPTSEKSGKAGHFNPALPYSEDDIKGLPKEGLFHEDPRHPGMYQPLISPYTSDLSAEQKKRFDALWEDFFFHRNEAMWERGAAKKLQALLNASGMLACGEDLGMVPACVGPLMEREGILSLEMPNMDKGRPWPVNAVCASSSHDMATLRMQMRDELGEDPAPELVEARLEGYLNSAPMLAIFPMQDWLAIDKDIRVRTENIDRERINDPSNPDNHWCWRMHLTVLELRKAESLNARIRGMLERTNRFREKKPSGSKQP